MLLLLLSSLPSELSDSLVEFWDGLEFFFRHFSYLRFLIGNSLIACPLSHPFPMSNPLSLLV